MPRKRKRGVKIGAVAITLAIIAAAVLVVSVLLNDNKAVDISLLKIKNAEKVYSCGTDIITYDGTTFCRYGTGKKGDAFSRSISSSTADICGSSGVNVVFNEKAMNIVGSRDAIEFEGEIGKVECGGDFVAVYEKSDTTKGVLHAFNSLGNEIMTLDFSTSVLTDFGFESKSAPVLWTVELVTAGDCVSSSVTTYDLSRGSVTGVMTVQGQLVKNIFFTESSVFVFCTREMIRFDRKTNKEVYSLLSYGYDCDDNGFSVGKSGVCCFALQPESESSMHIKFLKVKEKEVPSESSLTIYAPDDMLVCASIDGSLIIINANSVEKYGATGDREQVTEFDHQIERVIFLENGNFVVFGNGEFSLCKPRKKIL